MPTRLEHRKHPAAQLAFALAIVLAALCMLAACAHAGLGASAISFRNATPTDASEAQPVSFDPGAIPAYSGKAAVNMNGGVPFFSSDDLARGQFETYSPLDSLGRCGTAFALIGPETMPDEKRGSIGMIKPSGWQTSKYDWIDGKYLFNRCHLIAYALAGENDNPLNLITGTRSMNTQGMLPYEERTMEYIRDTGNHVLYRVTPYYNGDDLVASGVLMEAESVEDSGAGVKFCEWCYNVEPGVAIDYATGKNWAEPAGEPRNESGAATEQSEPKTVTYILNTNTYRFHYPDCPSVESMKEKNKQAFEGTREEAIAQGYKPCGRCNP